MSCERRSNLRGADMPHIYFVPVARHCVVSPIGAMGSAPPFCDDAWRLLKLAGRFGVCLSNREVPAGIPVC